MSDVCEYLLSYGASGEFGRFRSLSPISLQRGDRAVVRTHRGLEIAVCLCAAQSGHAKFLPNTTLGTLLRRATPEDEERELQLQELGQELFEAARRLSEERGLPVEILDVEVFLDGEQGVLHHLSWDAFDERDLVSGLASRFDLRVMLHSLRPIEEEHHGCGREGCGASSGDCSSCGSGGCGTCGSAKPDELKAHFAALREQMQSQNAARVSLL